MLDTQGGVAEDPSAKPPGHRRQENLITGSTACHLERGRQIRSVQAIATEGHVGTSKEVDFNNSRGASIVECMVDSATPGDRRKPACASFEGAKTLLTDYTPSSNHPGLTQHLGKPSEPMRWVDGVVVGEGDVEAARGVQTRAQRGEEPRLEYRDPPHSVVCHLTQDGMRRLVIWPEDHKQLGRLFEVLIQQRVQTLTQKTGSPVGREDDAHRGGEHRLLPFVGLAQRHGLRFFRMRGPSVRGTSEASPTQGGATAPNQALLT